MANVHKGEVGFDLEGKPYTLRFSANALCELEDALDCGINAVAAQLSKPESLRLKTVRAVFWAGLQDRHPQVTLQEAGEMVTALTLQGALGLIGQGLSAAFPQVDGVEGDTKQRPPQPAPATDPAGIGTTSSANGASSTASPTKPSGAARRATSSPTSPPAKFS